MQLAWMLRSRDGTKRARAVPARAPWATFGAIVVSLFGTVVGVLFFGALGSVGGFVLGVAFRQGGSEGALTGAYLGSVAGAAWGILLGGLWGLLFGMTLGADRARMS